MLRCLVGWCAKLFSNVLLSCLVWEVVSANVLSRVVIGKEKQFILKIIFIFVYDKDYYFANNIGIINSNMVIYR